MPTRLTINFARLTNDVEFEGLLRDLCAEEWGDSETKQFGRRGQNQYGVDVYGKPNDQPELYRAVQCKLRTTNKQLSKREIEQEVKSARKFPHKLDVLILATDAPRDTKTQILIDHISEREVQHGKFRVSIWFWNDITERMASYPKLLIKYYKDLFLNLTTLPFVERLVDLPLQIVIDKDGSENYVRDLQASLQFRGVRILEWNRHGHIAIKEGGDDGLEDGIIRLVDPSKARNQTEYLVASIIDLRNHCRRHQEKCPIFVIIPSASIPEFTQKSREHEFDLGQVILLDPEQTTNELANAVFEGVFRHAYLRRGGLSTIEITIRTTDREPRSSLLDMDWRQGLNLQTFPSEEDWNNHFISALTTVRRHILALGEVTRIQINAQLPIPAAIAAGFYFNLRMARVGVWTRKSGTSDFRMQFWLSDAQTLEGVFEPEWVVPVIFGAKSAIVELTTFVPIHDAVKAYTTASQLHVDTWVNLSLLIDGKAIENIVENIAVAFANEVGRLTRHLNSQGITDIHLFGRIPSALAVLIGQRLQACGRIHLYWFDNPSYKPAFVLS